MVSFSIITPVYNGEKYIAKCVESIAKTTYDLSKVEHIIVDDGSTDKTKEICTELCKLYKHVKFYTKSNGNWGSVINFVKSNKIVNNDYCIVCDADDFLSIDALSVINNKIGQNDIFSWSYHYWNGHKKGVRISPYMFLFKKEFTKIRDEDYFLSRYFIPCCLCFKKEIFYKIGDLAENVMYQDTILFLELQKFATKIGFTPKALSFYYFNNVGNTMSQRKTDFGINSMLKRIHYYEENNFIEAFSLEIIFNKTMRQYIRKNKIKFSFKHKPHFKQYPWWLRWIIFCLYKIIVKRYITIK